jgi:hypothetical protein
VSNAQVSVAFEVATGHVESLLFPNKRDPLNLTQYFPFGVIKNSMDFRKMLTRRPAALTLLSEAEYQVFYSNKAKEEGLFVKDGKKQVPDVEAAINLAEEERRAYQNKAPLPNARPSEPLHDVVQDDPHFGGKKEVRAHEQLQVEDVVNPRILHLCNQVKSELTDQEKMSANELLGELKSLRADLKMDDFEYIRAHGWYQSVKKWAKAAMADVAEKEGVDDVADSRL